MKIQLLHPKAVVPFYATEGAGSFDLTATEIEYVAEDKVIVKFGFATEIPYGSVATFKPRSNFCHKDWVMQNSPAEIDNDYRGEWIAKFQAIPTGIKAGTTKQSLALAYAEFPYKVGDRVVQGKFEAVHKFDIEVVDELAPSIRGTGGFGSTGIREAVDKKENEKEEKDKKDKKPDTLPSKLPVDL